MLRTALPPGFVLADPRVGKWGFERRGGNQDRHKQGRGPMPLGGSCCCGRTVTRLVKGCVLSFIRPCGGVTYTQYTLSYLLCQAILIHPP